MTTKVKDPKKIKIGKSSKIKGANYERKISKLFEEWFKKHDPKASIARTPQSGGHSKLAEDWNMSSDLTCNNPDFPFLIECKCNEAWDIRDLFKIKGLVFTSWWPQATKQSSTTDKIPLLVFTKKYHPDFVAMPGGIDFGKILIHSGNANPTVGFHEHKLIPDGMIICLLESLLESNPKEWIDVIKARNITPKSSKNTT